ncbi:UNVERIFIED_CONTAM: hypothetical protein FKN15_073187 [Acipenser sinensis]
MTAKNWTAPTPTVFNRSTRFFAQLFHRHLVCSVAVRESVMGQQAAKLPSFDGTSSWEAFQSQLEGRRQSPAADGMLRGDAQMALLSLAEEEMSSYSALVATLQRKFGNMGEPELLRVRFKRRERAVGKNLARLVTGMEREVG